MAILETGNWTVALDLDGLAVSFQFLQYRKWHGRSKIEGGQGKKEKVKFDLSYEIFSP